MAKGGASAKISYSSVPYMYTSDCCVGEAVTVTCGGTTCSVLIIWRKEDHKEGKVEGWMR